MSSEIDWYKHYKGKFSSLKFKKENLLEFYKQDKEFIDTVLQSHPKKIIEVGAGLARDSFALSSFGIEVTIFDIDENILAMVSENAKRMNLPINIIHGDFFDLSKYISKDTFDIVFHSGVLEHFENGDITKIIAEQLKIAPKVICSVPFDTESNRKYFSDDLYRRLMTQKEWEEILSVFKISLSKIIHGRHDDILLVLER
jgi:2-polyprenyl-3-methyl-5-hydroxy-6-metoxy-1,4-benzoquinol methylase